MERFVALFVGLLHLLFLTATTSALVVSEPTTNVFASGVSGNNTIPSSTTTSSSTTAIRGNAGGLPDIATLRTTSTSSSYTGDGVVALQSFARAASGGLLPASSTTTASSTSATNVLSGAEQSFAEAAGDLLPVSSAVDGVFGVLGNVGVQSVQLASADVTPTASTVIDVTASAVGAESAEAEYTGTILSEAEILAGCSSTYQGNFDFIEVRLVTPRGFSNGLEKRALTAPNSPYSLTNGVLKDRNLDTGFLNADSTLVYSKFSPNGSTFITDNWSACYSAAEDSTYLAYGKTLTFYSCREGYSIDEESECVDTFLELGFSKALPPVTSATTTTTDTFTADLPTGGILLPSMVKHASALFDADDEDAPFNANGRLRVGGVPATPTSSFTHPSGIAEPEVAKPTDVFLPPITTSQETATPSEPAFVTPVSGIASKIKADVSGSGPVAATQTELLKSITKSPATIMQNSAKPTNRVDPETETALPGGQPNFATPVDELVSSTTGQPSTSETSGGLAMVGAGSSDDPSESQPQEMDTSPETNLAVAEAKIDDTDQLSNNDNGSRLPNEDDQPSNEPSQNGDDEAEGSSESGSPGQRLVDAIVSAATIAASTDEAASAKTTAANEDASPQPATNAAPSQVSPTAVERPPPQQNTNVFATEESGMKSYPAVTTVVRSRSDTAFTFTVASATTREPQVTQVYRTSEGSVFSFDMPIVTGVQGAVPTTTVRRIDGEEVFFTFTPQVAVQTEMPTATTVFANVDGTPATFVLALPFVAIDYNGPVVTTALRTIGDSILSFTLTQPSIQYSLPTVTTITTQVNDRFATFVLPLPSMQSGDDGLDITTAVRTLGTSVLSFTLIAPTLTLAAGAVEAQETTILRTLDNGSTATFVITLPSASPSGASSSSHPGIGELIMSGLGGALAAQGTSSESTSLESLFRLTAVPTTSRISTSESTTVTSTSTTSSPVDSGDSAVEVNESGAATRFGAFETCWLFHLAIIVALLHKDRLMLGA